MHFPVNKYGPQKKTGGIERPFNGTSDGDVWLASSLRLQVLESLSPWLLAPFPIHPHSHPHHIHFTSHPFALFPLAQHPFTSHTLAFQSLVPQAHLHTPHPVSARRIPYGASTHITPKVHIHLHTTHSHTSTGDRDWRQCLEARLWPT